MTTYCCSSVIYLTVLYLLKTWLAKMACLCINCETSHKTLACKTLVVGCFSTGAMDHMFWDPFLIIYLDYEVFI